MLLPFDPKRVRCGRTFLAAALVVVGFAILLSVWVFLELRDDVDPMFLMVLLPLLLVGFALKKLGRRALDRAPSGDDEDFAMFDGASMKQRTGNLSQTERSHD
jgi:hypothetical protein